MINWQPFVKGDEVWIYYVGGDGEPSPSRAPAAPLTLLLPAAAVAPGPFHGYRTNQLMLAKIQRGGAAWESGGLVQMKCNRLIEPS